MNTMPKADFARYGLVLDDAELVELLGGVLSDVAARAQFLGVRLPGLTQWLDVTSGSDPPPPPINPGAVLLNLAIVAVVGGIGVA